MDNLTVSDIEKVVTACGGDPTQVRPYFESQIKGEDKYMRFMTTPQILLKHNRWILTERDGYRQWRNDIDYMSYGRGQTIDMTEELDRLLGHMGYYCPDEPNDNNQEYYKAIADEIVNGGYGTCLFDW